MLVLRQCSQLRVSHTLSDSRLSSKLCARWRNAPAFVHISILSSPLPNNITSITRCICASRPRYKEQLTEVNNKSAETSTSSNKINQHQPPLPVRIALVSTTTALATPSFPALGFLYAVLRITVPDANLRKVMEGRWGTLLSFTTWTLLPNLYHGSVASLILPCALGNAIVAGGVYGVADLALGGPSNKIIQTPWITGSGIGATVGYVGPHYLYGPLMESIYSMEGMTQSMQNVMSFPYATEVSVVTGAIAGMLLHPMLYFPMNGVQGVRWQLSSGAALALVTSALVYVYYGREEVGLPVPEGSYIKPSNLEFVESIVRYNNITNNVETYSLRKQQFIGPPEKCLEGQRIANASRSYEQSGNKVVFDDRVIAFIYNWWDIDAKNKYPEHILHIKSEHELTQTQTSMTYTDVAVASILQNEQLDNEQTVTKILTSINNSVGDSEQSKGQQLLKPASFRQLEDVTIALELLMTMRKLGRQEQPADIQRTQTLEQFIRKRFPQLTLYKSEEQYADESVESQLLNWNNGPTYAQALDRWQHVHEKEVYIRRRIRSLVMISGMLLAIAGSLIRGS